MVDLRIDEMNEETIDYLCGEIVRIFSDVSKDMEEQKLEFNEILGLKNPPIINNVELTPWGKILFLAKKVAKKVLISTLTGIDTMYIDDDTSSLFRRKGYDFYKQQEVPNLIYIGTSRLIDATNEFLRAISDTEKRKEILGQHRTNGNR